MRIKRRIRTFLEDWVPGYWYLGAGTDAPKLRAVFCKLGFCSPYYKYAPERFLSWKEIEAGAIKPPLEHLGWHCRVCERKTKSQPTKMWVIWNW